MQVMRASSLFVLLTLSLSRLAAQAPWKLVEELRIGGAQSGPASLNDIRDIAVDVKGQILLLDYPTQEIRVFDVAGKFVRTIGRKGAGPGEFNTVNGLLIAPDGRIWVNDMGNNRFDVFNPDGSYLKQVPRDRVGMQMDYKWNAAFDTDGRLMETMWTGADNARKQIIQRFNQVTAKWDSIPRPLCTLPPEREIQSSWNYPILPHGEGSVIIPFVGKPLSRLEAGGWWCSAGNTYQLKLDGFGARGTIAEIRHTLSPVAIPTTRRDSAIAEIKRQSSKVPPGTIDFAKLPKNYTGLDGLNVDEKGNLWVFRQGSEAPAVDVWSRAGKLLGTGKAPATVTAFIPAIIRSDKLYLMTQNEDGEPYLVRYRVVR